MKHNEKSGLQYQRVIVITNETINIMRRNDFNQTLVLRRRVQHRELRGISKSIRNQYEFLLHPINSHDIRILSDQ